jgi:hypothetical protein
MEATFDGNGEPQLEKDKEETHVEALMNAIEYSKEQVEDADESIDRRFKRDTETKSNPDSEESDES